MMLLVYQFILLRKTEATLSNLRMDMLSQKLRVKNKNKKKKKKKKQKTTKNKKKKKKKKKKRTISS